MKFLIFLPVLLFSVVVHEVAHALVAKWEGDETAYRLGRVTLNPLPHLDLVGSALVPLLLFFLPGDFLFGWARPVPVDPRNFRNFRRGDIRVSLAGIVANLALAALCTVLAVLFQKARALGGGLDSALLVAQEMAYFGIFINLILAVFNLLPIPPLDGSRVAYHFLPPRLRVPYRTLGRYGIGVLLLLLFLFPGAFSVLLWPVRLLLTAAELFIGLWG